MRGALSTSIIRAVLQDLHVTLNRRPKSFMPQTLSRKRETSRDYPINRLATFTRRGQRPANESSMDLADGSAGGSNE